MAVYEYVAIAKSSGKRVRGVIDADSAAVARRKLREQLLFPTDIRESFSAAKGKSQVQKGGGFGRVSPRDVSIMTRQLAVLLQAGMPLVEGLTALIDQTPNPRLQKIVYDVRDKVNSGVRLADALSGHGRVFSDLYVNMVGAGEASGALEQVLFRLADIQERQVKLNRRIQNALMYPIFMSVVGLSVISFLMVFIVPSVTDMFVKQKRELPFVTQLLIHFSHIIGQWWPLIIAVFAAMIAGWRMWVRRPAGRRKWDEVRLRIPLYRGLYIKLMTGRFARTLGTMLGSGLSMMTSLDVVKSVVQNRKVEEAMEDVKASVRRGKDLSVPLREMGVFPAMMISMVELGQRSGELEAMLLKVADTYDDEVESSVDALVGLLEPAMIVIMALFVGFLVIAMLLPILQMSAGI